MKEDRITKVIRVAADTREFLFWRQAGLWTRRQEFTAARQSVTSPVIVVDGRKNGSAVTCV